MQTESLKNDEKSTGFAGCPVPADMPEKRKSHWPGGGQGSTQGPAGLCPGGVKFSEMPFECGAEECCPGATAVQS